MNKAQYEKGYLVGQLDAAENELSVLRTILHEMLGHTHENDMINVRIRDTEEFLLEHGRSIESDEEQPSKLLCGHTKFVKDCPHCNTHLDNILARR